MEENLRADCRQRKGCVVTPTSDSPRSRGSHAFAVMSLTGKGAGPVQTYVTR